MIRKLATLSATAFLFGLLTVPVEATAATTTGTFDVNISLTAACELTTTPGATFNYAAFQTTAATFSSSFDIRCTNGLPIASIALDQTSVTDQATGLAYTLALANVPSTGTGTTQTVAISGSMAPGQAGTCASSTCTNTSSTNKRRTLTITY